MKYKLVYLGTCNSSYFQGSSLPTVQVLVDGTTTVGELKEQLKEYMTFEPVEYSLTDFIEDNFETYKQSVEDFWQEHNLDNETIFASTLEVPTEDEQEEWDCYAYFGIEEVND